MSENREYVSRSDELGNIHISGEVLASIAAAAALEVEGVSGLSANLGSDIAELLSNKKNLTKGVHIQVEDEQVTVELAVLMSYGHTIPEVGRAVQDAVKSSVESMTGLTVAAVNVGVGGITLEKKEQQTGGSLRPLLKMEHKRGAVPSAPRFYKICVPSAGFSCFFSEKEVH